MMNDLPIKSIGIAAVILKKINKIYHVLLLKRNSQHLNNTWCYLGGRIEAGETAIDAVFREIREETGITELQLYSANQFDKIFSPKENYIYIAPVFVGFVQEEQPVILNDEHSEYQWFPFEEAKGVISLPGNEEVLQSIENNFVKKKPLIHLKI